MATIKICDECGREGKLPFIVTEKDGTVWEVCTPKCFIDRTAKLDQEKGSP